ncbi:YpoC family protein [Mesobacillus campisalis]|uniref:YpoC family protein n=1 Tax=Mesobacillus campisalis TaxID=1408103 RepID=UPI00069A461D|nr:hypothetical protein [Mesobacillus campisalis]
MKSWAESYNGEKEVHPWEKPEKYIPMLLNEWEKLKEEIGQGHSVRDSIKASGAMEQGIDLFLKFVYWSNRMPVSLPLENLKTLGAKPVNVEERLKFIMGRPGLYHSYIQLSELMNEQHKQFARSTLTFHNGTQKTAQEP